MMTTNDQQIVQRQLPFPTNGAHKEVRMELQTLSALLGRAELAARLGQSYDNERDIYEALGYQTVLRYKDYATQYERQDMAKAIIDRPVVATWQGGVRVVEMSDNEETQLEKAWSAINSKMQLITKFVRLDKLASLGSFGVLLFGFDDIASRSAMIRPVSPGGSRQLLYVMPFSEGSVEVNAWENDSSNARYGLPLNYKVTLELPNSTTDIMLVHHSRILHVTGELLESEVEGVPVLKSVFNRLKDLEKLVGASAEMFWRGARPGYQAKVRDDYRMTTTMQDDLQDQIDEYEHNLRRMLAVEGVEFAPLQMQVSDPATHVDIQVQMISAITGIPKRILVGSERGELASTEDRSQWLNLIQSRRDGYAEVQIVRPFIDRCIEYGVLPKPSTEEYKIEWSDLYAMSEKERADIGKVRASALREYTTMPETSAIMPRRSFLSIGLGLQDEQVDRIEKERMEDIDSEAAAQAELERMQQEIEASNQGE